MLYNKKIINNLYKLLLNDKGFLLYLKKENLYNLIEEDKIDWKYSSKSNEIILMKNKDIYFQIGRFFVAYESN